VNYELPVAEIVSRLSGRRICEKCKAVFHVTRQPSRSKGICDECGGRLYRREDDRPESVKLRLEVYLNSNAPLIKFYSQLGLVVPVAATGSPEEICARTMSVLEKRQ
jgi:adenylate kinase